MATVPLIRPSTHTGAVLGPTGPTGIGTAGLAFFLKMYDSDLRYSSPAREVTGDGDNAPVWMNNGYLYGRHAMRGAMVAAQAQWIVNMIEPSRQVSVLW